MNGYKRLLETHEISDFLTHKIFITSDEEKLFLNIEYDDRFKIEKQFKNNVLGLSQMDEVRKALNTDEKLLHYLGLGDKNG